MDHLLSGGGLLGGVNDISGINLELSEREKFCDNFRILGRSFGPNLGFLYIFYTFSLLPQLNIGRSQPAWADFFSQIAL